MRLRSVLSVFARFGCVCLLCVLSANASVATTLFPLKISSDGRYLIDQAGHPFLVSGDTAWSLIADLTREDIALYLDHRAALGFNTVLVSLVEHKYSRNAPKNGYGVAPFPLDRAFREPVAAYFDHAVWFVEQAAARGMLVLLAPAYLGIAGGDEGWSAEMAAAGPIALEAYGAYLGRRFGALQNIVWLQGGDADPSDPALVTAVVAGLKRTAPAALQSVHGGRDSVVGDVWAKAGWIDIGMVYTYGDVAAAMETSVKALPDRPALLLESTYENEHGASAQDIRKAAWTAILSGSAGFVFGNSPIWHFAGPDPFGQAGDWHAALGSQGAGDMSRLFAFLRKLDWWTLQPAPVSTREDAPAGIAANGSFALAYVSDAVSGQFPLLMAALRDERCRLWLDPTSGSLSAARKPPPRNAGGDTDWVLLALSGDTIGRFPPAKGVCP